MVGAESRGCAVYSFSFRKQTARGLSSRVLALPTLATAAVDVAHGERVRSPRIQLVVEDLRLGEELLQVVLSVVLLTLSNADLDVSTEATEEVEALCALVDVRKLLAGLHAREAGCELGNVRADATDLLAGEQIVPHAVGCFGLWE
eukprot:3941483-Rhodomonas_salina.1